MCIFGDPSFMHSLNVSICEKQLDPDPLKMNADAAHCTALVYVVRHRMTITCMKGNNRKCNLGYIYCR